MTKQLAIKHLLNYENILSVNESTQTVPKQPGLYAIFIREPKKLPDQFKKLLTLQNTKLIYVGKASIDLHKRLIKQDLKHQGPSTFFRSLGAVLGYRPPFGSLRNINNKNNYKFNREDTKKIITWIDNNLCVSWYELDRPETIEPNIIKHLKPAFNLKYNPNAITELYILRSECKKIACSNIYRETHYIEI